MRAWLAIASIAAGVFIAWLIAPIRLRSPPE